MKYGLLYLLALWFILNSFTFEYCQNSQRDSKPIIDKEKFVARHNYYRKQLGVDDVEWSDELAVYAQQWADRLALKCKMQHRKADGYGENIYWYSGQADEHRVVDKWAAEEKYFNHRKRTYIKGSGSKSGHYSQIIWANTKFIGAGVANCKGGGQIWVCNYDPPGNVIGEKAY